MIIFLTVMYISLYFIMLQSQVQTDSAEIAASSTSQGTWSERPSPYTMTEEILQQRLKHENRGRYITQLYAALAASLAAFSFGTILGWSSPSAHHLLGEMNTYNLSKEDFGWATSLMPLGCSAGILPWSYTVYKIGPKHTLILQAPLYILTFVVMMTVRKLQSYLIGRFLSGFLSIANLIGGECLLMDTVHRGNLPHMIVFFRSSIWLGVLAAYIIGYFWSKFILTIICAIVPAVNTILLVSMPESPVFLYDKSELKAEKALGWYRGPANVNTEMRSLRKDAEIRNLNTESYQYMFYSKVVMKGLLVVLGLSFFQVFSGYYALVFYKLMLWEAVEHVYEPYNSIAFGLVLYISNFIATMVHYRVPYGVRKPLLLSTSLTAIILTITTAVLFLQDHKTWGLERYGFMPDIMVNSFVISYEIGLGTYADILLFEYLPYQVYGRAKITLQICFWVQVFLFTKYFIKVRDVTNDYIPFGILAAVAFVGIVYCYIFVVETKGKNLIQIQIEIGGNPIGNRGAYRNRIGPAAIPVVI